MEGGSVTRTLTYYPVAGALRINSTLYYILKDQLGSASVVTDSTGTTVGEQRYYPFGQTRLTTGSMYTDKLFTGQREMAGLGIYHYNARFYSPTLGRFLSADTIVPGAANPQAFNRYAYVLNNPLRYTDPTGHCSTNRRDDDYCPGYSGFSAPLGWVGSGGGGGDGGGAPVVTPIVTPIPAPPTVTVTPVPPTTQTATVMAPLLPTPTITSTGTPPASFTQNQLEQGGDPVVSVVGAVLTIQLGILDAVLSYGVAAVAICGVTVPGCQVGLAGELVLVPLDFISWNLTIYAAQMASTGSADHDPLPILHLMAPNLLPYRP